MGIEREFKVNSAKHKFFFYFFYRLHRLHFSTLNSFWRIEKNYRRKTWSEDFFFQYYYCSCLELTRCDLPISMIEFSCKKNCRKLLKVFRHEKKVTFKLISNSVNWVMTKNNCGWKKNQLSLNLIMLETLNDSKNDKEKSLLAIYNNNQVVIRLFNNNAVTILSHYDFKELSIRWKIHSKVAWLGFVSLVVGVVKRQMRLSIFFSIFFNSETSHKFSHDLYQRQLNFYSPFPGLSRLSTLFIKSQVLSLLFHIQFFSFTHKKKNFNKSILDKNLI